MDKLKEVKKIIQMMNEGSVTTQDLQTFITATLEFVKKQKDDFLQISQDSIDEIDKIVLYIEKEHEKTLQKVDEKSSKLEQELTKQIKEVKYLLEGAKNLIPQDGRDGLNGKDGKDGSPDTPEEIVKKINTTENSIDAKVIKDSATYVRKNDLDYAVSVLENQTRFLIASNSNRGSSTGGGGTWGSITGTLSDQTDLQSALNAKQNTITTGTTAQYFRGDLSLATFPTNVSTFTNDSGYITSSALTGYVPTTRTLTINGTTLDLSADRSWTISSGTASTGLTNTSGTWTANLSTGISGGQSAIGGTASGNNLTLSSTSHATKGKILFGTSAYDEVNNRLGIGTTSPGYKLDIQGAAAETSLTNTTNNNRISFGFPPAAGGEPSLSAFTPGVTNGRIFQRQTSTKDVFIGDIDANGGGVHIRTNGNDSLNILSGGNVGIGQSSPTAYLHLKAGTATAGTAPIKLTSGTNLTTPENGTFEYDGTSLFFTPASTRYNVLMNGLGLAGGQTVVGGTASGNNLTLSSTSNATKGKILFGTSAYDEVNNRLGVGTNSPSVGDFGSTFTVKGTGSEVGIITAQRNVSAVGNGTGFQTVLNNASSNPVTYSYFNGYIITNTAGAESGGLMFYTRNAGTLGARMTILNDGNTGIGTTSPTAVLHLKAGTATAGSAPLKLTAGTNLTTPENGAFEFDGTNLYFTVGGVRKTVTLV